MQYRNALDKAWYTFAKTKFFQKVHDFVVWHPNPIMRTREVPAAVKTEGYRYPAPGSQPMAIIPTTENASGQYDINHFKRDVTRFPREVHVVLADNLQTPAGVKESLTTVTKLSDEFKVTFLPEDKPVNPQLFRDYKTIKPEEVEIYVTQQLPNHLPAPFWTANANSIVEEYESKNLPPVPGKRRNWNVPKKLYENLW